MWSVDLLARLADAEDRFVERKLESGGSSTFKRAIVAFANSLPPNRSAVLFIGVEDDGTVRGVENPDSLQRKVRHLAENECYPPIYVTSEVLTDGQHKAVAVVVGPSVRKPHFAGAAYVRRGSGSVAATEDVYRDLLLSQDDKRRFLQDGRSEVWTVEFLDKKPG